jgi:hypothetical protein
MADQCSPALINTNTVVEECGLSSNIKLSWEIVDITDVTIVTLCHGSNKQRQKCIEKIETSPENYSPLVFYILANILYQQGQPNQQFIFWYYFGQLRVHYDAARCTDETAFGSVASLATDICGCLIQEIYMKDTTILEPILERVIELDRKVGHNYNPYWINSYGLEGTITRLNGNEFNEKDFSVPEEEWDHIAEQTRVNFLKMHKEIIQMFKNDKIKCNGDDWILL